MMTLRAGLERDPAAIPRIKRLARQVADAGSKLGDPVVAMAADNVATCDVSHFALRLDVLMDVIVCILDVEIGHDVARLLLVEDDDDFAEVILAVLAAPGRELTRVTGLASARDVLVSEPVDLVLLDLGLADGDGRQLLHELSRLPVDVRPEVHVLTARLEPALQAECVVLGAAGVHRKPIDTGALVTVLAMRIAVLLERRMERLYDHETGLLNPQGLAARWAARTFDGDEVASCLFLTGSGGGASPEHVHRLVDATLLATQCADLVARIAPDVVFVMLDGAADRDIEVVVQSLEAEWYRRGDAPTRGGELICELIQVFGAMPLRTVLSVGQLRLSASRSLSERVAQELDAMFGEPAMDDCAQG